MTDDLIALRADRKVKILAEAVANLRERNDRIEHTLRRARRRYMRAEDTVRWMAERWGKLGSKKRSPA